MGFLNISFTDMNLIQMSFSAAIMILAIILIRKLVVNKLPKKVFVLLWGVVLLRLLIPFSIPSAFSAYTFVSKSEPLQEIMTENPVAEVMTQMTGTQTNQGGNMNTALPSQTTSADISMWEIVWIVGLVLCIAYFTVSYLRCHFEFRTSLPVENDYIAKWLGEHRLKRTIQIRQSDLISAPLTYGVVKPVILMPKKTDWENKQQLSYVLLHEYTHVCRFDTLAKLVATFALCIHWFNPLVWVMYIHFNRDIELSCDESVVKEFGENSKTIYARTLITMEEKKSGLIPLYHGFSRNAIEERIVAIMKTKKVTIRILLASVLVIMAVIVPFATSAKGLEEPIIKEETQQETIEDTEEGSISETAEETEAETITEMETAPVTPEDFYQVATYLSATEVEQYALSVKKDILGNDWESLSEKILYPIEMNGVTVNDKSAFLSLANDSKLNSDFVNVIANESCRAMFCSWRGIMMGNAGQIWLGSVETEAGHWEQKVIGIHDMFEEE